MVLREEHAALRKLDRDAIARAAEQKLELDAKLKAALPSSWPAQEDLPLVRRVRNAALNNQLLIVHARACVQSVLSMVAGDAFSTYPGAAPSRAAPLPLRLDVRG
jgi:hypothetical protein